MLHEWGLSGMCDNLCLVRWSFLFRAALQMSQTNLRSTACWMTCCSTNSRSGYAIWHSGHKYNLEPSKAVVSRISPGFGRGFFSFGARFFFSFLTPFGCFNAFFRSFFILFPNILLLVKLPFVWLLLWDNNEWEELMIELWLGILMFPLLLPLTLPSKILSFVFMKLVWFCWCWFKWFKLPNDKFKFDPIPFFSPRISFFKLKLLPLSPPELPKFPLFKIFPITLLELLLVVVFGVSFLMDSEYFKKCWMEIGRLADNKCWE